MEITSVHFSISIIQSHQESTDTWYNTVMRVCLALVVVSRQIQSADTPQHHAVPFPGAAGDRVGQTEAVVKDTVVGVLP